MKFNTLSLFFHRASFFVPICFSLICNDAHCSTIKDQKSDNSLQKEKATFASEKSKDIWIALLEQVKLGPYSNEKKVLCIEILENLASSIYAFKSAKAALLDIVKKSKSNEIIPFRVILAPVVTANRMIYTLEVILRKITDWTKCDIEIHNPRIVMQTLKEKDHIRNQNFLARESRWISENFSDIHRHLNPHKSFCFNETFSFQKHVSMKALKLLFYEDLHFYDTYVEFIEEKVESIIADIRKNGNSAFEKMTIELAPSSIQKADKMLKDLIRSMPYAKYVLLEDEKEEEKSFEKNLVSSSHSTSPALLAGGIEVIEHAETVVQKLLAESILQKQ